MKFLGAAWWQLSWRWFGSLESRVHVARRGLFRNSFKVAVLGLAMGVAALSLVRAIVNGFESTLARGISKSLGDLVFYTHWSDFEELKNILQEAPEGWREAQFFWTTQGLIVGPRGGRGVMIEGRRESSAVESSQIEIPEVSLGRPLADYLGVKVGDEIKLLLPGVLKGALPAIVSELLDHGMYQIDSRFVVLRDDQLRAWMSVHDPKSYSERPGDAHGIRFFMKESWSSLEGEKKLLMWKQQFRESLQNKSESGEALLKTWREQRKNLLGAVDHEKGVLTFVLSLLTIVASLNVAATLLVLYLERDRDMAMLQVMGMSKGLFIQWIALQGFLLGLLASALGLFLARILGFLLLKMPFAKLPSDIYNISELPLLFKAPDEICVFVFGILSALVMASFLGYRLSRISLLETLAQRR